MTPGIIDGTLIRLTIDGDKFIHAQSSNLDMTTATEEISTKDTGSDGSFTETALGKHSWSAGAEGLLSGDETIAAESRANYIDLFNAWKAKQLIAATWSTGVVGDQEFSGNAYITNLSMNAADGEKATCSIQLTGTGAIDIAVVA